MIYAILFILGCCIGSFVNVIFSRKDWYKGRSRCDGCGYVLRWYDLIPVISYLLLGGKCRKCKTKIENSHLVSELMMGAAFLVSSFCYESYGLFYGMLIFSSLFCMTVAAIEDYKEQMVYNFILLGGILVSAGVKCSYYIYNEMYVESVFLIGGVFCLKLLALLASFIFMNRIGSGDFDVLIVICIIGGLNGLIISVTVACVIGCFIYLPAIIMKKRDKKEPLPFIPLLLTGTMLYILI